jgi:hypothetical protein
MPDNNQSNQNGQTGQTGPTGQNEQNEQNEQNGPTGTTSQNSQNGQTSQTGQTGTTAQTSVNLVITQLDQTIVEPGIKIINQQGIDANKNEVTHTTFTTTDPTFDTQINENLIETVIISDIPDTPASTLILSDIKLYASKITCSDFHGKGSIDDYTELFVAAANIANESKQISLDVDIDGFNEFGNAADELSALFTSYIIKLQNINIISDIDFLTAVSISLKKIWNLSEVFGRFKKTILATSTIQIPKSAHETKVILDGVITELNCAMQYIGHFVNPSSNSPEGANLSAEEQNVISKAVSTIESWNILAEQGVSIAMSNNPDIQSIHQANTTLKNQTASLRDATNRLKLKLASYNITN